MKNLLFPAASAGLLISMLSAPVSAIPVTNDLWDVSQTASVNAHSGVLGSSNINNMFGGGPAGVEPWNTLFRDYAPSGTVHWVEWQTTSTNTLRSISLYTMYDGGARDARYRGYSLFTLYGWNTSLSIWDQIYQLAPIDPTTNRLISTYAGSNPDLLDYAVDVSAYTTDKFKAEFTQIGGSGGQYPGPGNASGPRIMEIDGFNTFLDGSTGDVPEPTTLALMGLGLAGIGWKRRKAA